MRGAMIKTFGEPSEVLELVDVPEPTRPAEGEVLVGVEYAPVNMNDLYVIQGAFPVRPSLPSFVGNEGVGRVLAVGSGVEHLKVDDRILIPLYAFSWREQWSCLRQVCSASPTPTPATGDARHKPADGVPAP